MKIRFLALFFFLSYVFIAKTLYAKIAPAPSHDEIKLKSELSAIQKDIQKLEKNVSSHQKQEEILNQELAVLEKDIGEQTDQLRLLENKKLLHRKSLMELEQKIEKLQKTHETQLKALSHLVRECFYHQQKEKFQLLLEPQEWSVRVRQASYYRFFSRARKKEMEQLTTHIKEVSLLSQNIAQEQILLEETSRNVTSKKTKLNEIIQKRKTLLITLTDDLKSYNKRMIYLQQQEHQLEKLFKKLQTRLSTTYIDPVQDFAKMKHQLTLPILENNVTFSALPHLKASSQKTYIHAPNGTPVNAIFPGRVVFAEWLRGVGLLIILDHGNGYLSLYGNNEKLYKGLGDWVGRGEMIARVGQSGGHTEPGLYFEIRKDGKTIDPTPWFSNLG